MDRLRILRKEHLLTQTDLGKSIGVSASTIGMYEQGRRDPDSDTLTRLANYFNVSTDYLLGNTDIEKPNSTAARPLTLEEKERAIKEWLRAIAQAAGNEKALAAIEKIRLIGSTGELRLEDASDLDNALLQLQAKSMLTVLEKARQEGKTAVEWHNPQKKE